MPHPWLIRFKFSAAIALPSMSLLWFVLPTRAVESPHQHLPETAQLAQPGAIAQSGSTVPDSIDADSIDAENIDSDSATGAPSEQDGATGNQNSLLGNEAGHTSSVVRPLIPVAEVSPPFLATPLESRSPSASWRGGFTIRN